nr:uncharacterized protein LOC113723667 isoform X2 [Coffea arabica]XP_027112968.1 uncharacterized protein LOC113731495 [Coffea arabica]
MADALVAASIQIVLEKLVSATTDVIGVAFGGFKEELEKLKGSVAMIQAVMADAEKKQVQNQDVQLWLKRLEGVAFDADNLLDEINYEFLRRRMETQNRLKQKRLSLVGQPQSDSLPVQLQYLTSLTALGLHGFGVEVLPDWLANLASLEELRLDGCEKLQHLPSTAAMRRLTKLKFLGSFGCSLLEKNFTPGATSEWPKIFNISHIQFEDKPIGAY